MCLIHGSSDGIHDVKGVDDGSIGCWIGINLDVGLIVVIKGVLIGGLSKKLCPSVGIEIGEVVYVGRDGGKPVVENDMKLSCDISGCRIKNKRDGAGVFGRESHIGAADAAWGPSWKLFPVGDCLV